MRFEEFVKGGAVQKRSPDPQLAKSLASTAAQDLEFLRKLDITDESARKVFVAYYDTLRSVVEAMAALEGYKAYSHEALTAFLKERDENAELFDRMRRLRNSVSYYGKAISPIEVREHKADMVGLIRKLQEKLPCSEG